jgi:glyoxylase-like metal-dependent hydrolase (beta-lactamase superfamily II)
MEPGLFAWYFIPDREWWQGLAGAAVGLAPLLLGLYIGVLVGGLVAIFVYASRLFGFNRVVIPYGPYLVSGGIISMLYFRQITDWIETSFRSVQIVTKIDVVQVGALGTNCYVIHSVTGSDCIVIDPGGEAAKVINFLDQRNLIPSRIISTHAHADHTGGVAPLAERYGSEFMIGADDIQAATQQSPMLTDMLGDFVDPPAPSQQLTGGETLTIDDDVEIVVLATPGHTQGSICLHVEDHVITGDTLFRESIGRYDLPGGNGEQEIESIKTILMILEDSTVVLPGHGPSTTIGHEKTANPFLR